MWLTIPGTWLTIFGMWLALCDMGLAVLDKSFPLSGVLFMHPVCSFLVFGTWLTYSVCDCS